MGAAVMRGNGRRGVVFAAAGAASAAAILVLIAIFSARAMDHGTLALIDENGRRIGAAVAQKEPAEEEDTETEPLFTQEELAMLAETPEETEEVLAETPAVFFSVEPVEEIVRTEAVLVESRTQGDPFAAAGSGTDDEILWAEAVPEAYDGNDRNGEDVVTEVRNQGGSNLCWAYAALGAVESNLLVRHPTLGADRLDLSEKHLSYYVMNPASGSVGGLIDGDYREIRTVGDEESEATQAGLCYIMSGGVTDFILSALAAWKGPVDDTAADSFDRQRNGRITIAEQGTPSSPYGGDYHVQGIYEIAGADYNREAIKRMILNYGAVTCSVHADQTAGNSYWFLANLYDGDPYGENNNLADHETLVVGWDDAYETDNFSPEPAHEGAWLCRNSWGATAGEGGYFWLSYDDVIFTNNNVAAYNVALRGDADYYDRNYQVAGILTHVTDMMIDQNNVVYTYSASKNPYGVLYTVEDEETLAAVSLIALETENEYTIEIYQNPDISDDGSIAAESIQEPALSQTVRSASGGYHTYALDETLSLHAGDSFLVFVRPAQASALVYEKAMTATGDANYDSDYGYVGNVHTETSASGLSFYPNADGSAIVPQEDRDFFVKAFTRVQ